MGLMFMIATSPQSSHPFRSRALLVLELLSLLVTPFNDHPAMF